MNEVPIITIDEARAKMFELLKEKDLGDQIYELAQSVFQECIKEVESSSKLDEAEDYLDTDQEWYDEIQDEFYQAVYSKAAEFLTAK